MSKRNPLTLGVWGTEKQGGTRTVAAEAYWREPLKWNRDAEKARTRRRVFCASLADVFEKWDGPMTDTKGQVLHVENWSDGLWGHHPGKSLPPLHLQAVRHRLWELIEKTPWLDWLLLTKRPENVGLMVPNLWLIKGFPANVWMGVTAENPQPAAGVPT